MNITIYFIVLTLYLVFFVTSKGIAKTIHYEESLLFSLLLFVEYLFYDKGFIDVLFWIVSIFLVIFLSYMKNRLSDEIDSFADYIRKAYMSRKSVYSRFDNMMGWFFILVCYNLINKFGRDSVIVVCIPIAYLLLERGYMFSQNRKLKRHSSDSL